MGRKSGIPGGSSQSVSFIATNRSDSGLAGMPILSVRHSLSCAAILFSVASFRESQLRIEVPPRQRTIGA